MRKLFSKNVLTAIVVVSTIVLAAIAIFTGYRLYQMRNQTIERSKAGDCSTYTFSVLPSGQVRVVNNSQYNEPPQNAQVYIDGQLKGTYPVPALAIGGSATIATVDLPKAEFTWEVKGTLLCQNKGVYRIEHCALVSFTINKSVYTCNSSCTTDAQCEEADADYVCDETSDRCRLKDNLTSTTCEPDTTPTPTPTATPTGTPTATPTGTASPTPTGTATSTPTGSTSTPAPTGTPKTTTSTSTPLAQKTTTPSLPEAGTSLPTVLGIVIGFAILIGGILLAL